MYPLLRIRDTAVSQYNDLSIPTQWMLDSGLVGKVCAEILAIKYMFSLYVLSYKDILQIKVAAVQLARKFMKRVISELDSAADACTLKVPQREFLLLQGVRFALRVHQVPCSFLLKKARIFGPNTKSNIKIGPFIVH